MDSIDKARLPIVCATCCAHTLLFCELPWCVGCISLSEICCIGIESCLKCDADPICCEIDEKNNPNNKLCQLGCYCCGIYLKRPSTCVKVSNQFMCFVNQVAIPCDSTTPCILSLLCCTLYPKCGFCMKFGEVQKNGTCGYCVPPSKK